MSLLSTSACSLSELVDVDPLSIGSSVSAEDIRTYQGALMMYNAAIGSMGEAWSRYVVSSAFWTDELASFSGANVTGKLDARVQDQTTTFWFAYRDFQAARGKAAIAIEALRAHSSYDSRVLQAELYAIKGYATVFLAEGFCSGIPLSEVKLNGEIHLTSGKTTEQMLLNAAALFDTALTYKIDSVPIRTLIHVGYARALLNLGRYEEAAHLAASVDLEDSYRLHYHVQVAPFYPSAYQFESAVRNHEGGTSTRWVASLPDIQDVRIPLVLDLFQAKYDESTTNASMADGIEAKLILAESQLATSKNTSDTEWLNTLNTLRALKRASDGAPLLPDLEDPDVHERRIDMLFRERGFWLFLTGHRQGDLRRLIRDYGKSVSSVYPWGEYSGTAASAYGETVVFQPDQQEYINSQFQGCYDNNP